eukprot:163184_1
MQIYILSTHPIVQVYIYLITFIFILFYIHIIFMAEDEGSNQGPFKCDAAFKYGLLRSPFKCDTASNAPCFDGTYAYDGSGYGGYINTGDDIDVDKDIDEPDAYGGSG